MTTQTGEQIESLLDSLRKANTALHDAEEHLEATLLDLSTPYEYAVPILSARERISNALRRINNLQMSLWDDLAEAHWEHPDTSNIPM